jgi:8-oxo-dGTP pyrophosphatase MutT (NUDIX family)
MTNMTNISATWPDSGRRAFKSYQPPDLKVYGCICISPNNTILLVKGRKSQKWSFPKGHRERTDYSSLDCALRELKEETGVTLENNYVAVKKYKAAEYYIYSVPYEYSLLPYDTREVEEADWFTFSQVKELNKNIDVSMFCNHVESSSV